MIQMMYNWNGKPTQWRNILPTRDACCLQARKSSGGGAGEPPKLSCPRPKKNHEGCPTSKLHQHRQQMPQERQLLKKNHLNIHNYGCFSSHRSRRTEIRFLAESCSYRIVISPGLDRPDRSSICCLKRTLPLHAHCENSSETEILAQLEVTGLSAFSLQGERENCAVEAFVSGFCQHGQFPLLYYQSR